MSSRRRCCIHRCRSRGPGPRRSGLAPTGRPVRYDEVFFLRFAEGRITEIWGLVDTSTLRQQLGLVRA
ncbi:ester cyclase [Nocardia colli]|uniref:ester cyclase n=1 Tax=Nocardia colli TaxID=2545717 RepID=UPI001CC4E71D